MRIEWRHFSKALAGLIIISFWVMLLAGTPGLSDATEPDTVKGDEQAGKTLEIEIGDEGVIVRTPGEKRTQMISKSLIIAGDSIDLSELDSALINIESGSIIKFGEPINVAVGELVDGDLVSFGAPITVAGLVHGDVIVIGDMVHVRSSGVIRGDVHTYGGSIKQDPGGQIRGQRVGVEPFYFRTKLPTAIFTHPLRSFVASGVPLMISIIFSLILAVLVTMIVPRNVERIRGTIEKGPGKSFLIGFIASILFMPLFLLLCITIIGLPVALIVLPIVYFVVEVMGFAGISLWVGRKLQRGSSSTLPSPAARVAVGALILELPLIFAWVFTFIGNIITPLQWPFQIIGLIIVVLGAIILTVATVFGMGAAIWSRLGRQPVPSISASCPPPSETLPAAEEEDTEGSEPEPAS
jgi:hypothetical protein